MYLRTEAFVFPLEQRKFMLISVQGTTGKYKSLLQLKLGRPTNFIFTAFKWNPSDFFFLLIELPTEPGDFVPGATLDVLHCTLVISGVPQSLSKLRCLYNIV